MTVQIDTTAENNGLRLVTQGAHASSPSSGHVILYYVTGTASPGLYTKDSNGQQIGPFITGSAVSTSTITLISEKLPTGTTASFTAIPGTYKHLLIEYIARSTKAATSEEIAIFINGDTTLTNYRNARMFAYAAGTVGGDGSNLSDIDAIPAASSPANSASIGFIDIPYYASTTFNKLVRVKSTSRRDDSSVFQIVFDSGVEWENTSAVTQVDVKLSSGNFVPGSTFRLYGVN